MFGAWSLLFVCVHELWFSKIVRCFALIRLCADCIVIGRPRILTRECCELCALFTGTAVLNDYRRRGRGVTVAVVDNEVYEQRLAADKRAKIVK